MVTLHNVRLGFANNSSSSHSIVFLKGDLSGIISDYGPGYGWDFFTCADRASKENYLISTIACDLEERLGKETALIVLSHLLDRDPLDIDADGWVDGQSRLLVPREYRGKGVDPQFWDDLYSAVMQDNVVILGGNDNDAQSHHLAYRSEGSAVPERLAGLWGDWVARKDGEVWALFDQQRGHKIRISFNQLDPTRQVLYPKASLPELVDVKITDFCPYNCPFCYQDSTVAGKHADTWKIGRLSDLLSQLKVFEVALGGGEPTLHPDFLLILKLFRKNDIVPNFTTRNLAWLRDETIVSQVRELAGSFAFSSEDLISIKRLSTAIDYHGFPREKVTVQLIAGATYPYPFSRMIKTCQDLKLPVTILGYKETGRGANFEPKATPQQIWDAVRELAQSVPYLKVGIDTVFASQIAPELEKDGVSKLLYHTQDGVFSCYVDMVRELMAPSSYCEDSKYVPCDIEDSKKFGEIYRTFSS